MAKVLVVYGHPAPGKSLANRTILETLKEKCPDIEILKLSEEGFAPHVEEDQKKLVNADVIVFQFPIFWYSYPALMKLWVEETFAHGFAYGSTGTALKGKKLIISCTTGSPTEAYVPGGPNGHYLKDFFYNFQQLAALCSMEYLEPVYSHGCAYIPGVMPESVKDRVIAACKAHGEKLAGVLKSL